MFDLHLTAYNKCNIIDVGKSFSFFNYIKVVDVLKKVLLIINPKAGMMKIRSKTLDIIDLFTKNDCLVTAVTTKCKGDATEIAKKYAKDFDLTVCSGGDGTLNEVIAGVITLDSPVTLGYIPAGTTNDFASSLNISSDPTKSALGAINGTPQTFDIGKFGDSYFTYVASFGAFTSSSYSAPQATKNALGHLAYILEGMKDLSSLRPYQISISANGKTYEGKYILGSVSNSVSIGGMIKMDKNLVKFNDGVFEVMLIKYPENIDKFNKILHSIQTQKYDPEVIDFFQAPKLSVSMEEITPWSLDGEYNAGAKNIEISVLPSAIKLNI